MLIDRRESVMETEDAMEDWSQSARAIISTLQNRFPDSLTAALELLHCENKQVVQDLTQLATLPMHYQVSWFVPFRRSLAQLVPGPVYPCKCRIVA